MKKLEKLSGLIIENLFEKIFIAWFLSASIQMVFNRGEITISGGSIVTFIVFFISSFVIVSCVGKQYKKFVIPILIFVILAFSVILLSRSDSIYTFLALAIIYTIAVYHFFNKNDGLQEKPLKKLNTVNIVLCTVVFFGAVTAVSVFRYIIFAAPNFDFGIFCNMYHNMKNTFLPTVSCERNQLLSHFAVHFSPALYVFLPIYFIIPHPLTIAVCQTVAIYSAVIPFILIMKHRKLPDINIILLTIVFFANTAFAKGCYFDFHENCLLPPFLMWMFYFYEKKKTIPMFIFALLTLMVKEDAFIYVCIFALFIFIANKDFKKSTVLVMCAVVYFIAACTYLENFGTGIMSNRYDVLINDNEGLLGIVKTVFKNPAYAIEQIFSSEVPDAKLIYFIQMFAPLAFIPLMPKNPTRYILALPVLLNLLTDYPYQYDIKFQYGFGITSLMLYACIINSAESEKKKRDFTNVVAAGLAIMMFVSLMSPKFVEYVNRFAENKEVFEEIEEVLDTIPDDVSVTTSTFFVPHLWDRTEVYEAYYRDKTDTDYIVLDMRSNQIRDSLEQGEKYEALGYIKQPSGSEYVAIYKKGN